MFIRDTLYKWLLLLVDSTLATNAADTIFGKEQKVLPKGNF